MTIVSLDTGHFDDVIRSYHRLLDLQKKHLDVEVLNILVKCIVTKQTDADGNSAERCVSNDFQFYLRKITEFVF
jgi:hypothetical protein